MQIQSLILIFNNLSLGLIF